MPHVGFYVLIDHKLQSHSTVSIIIIIIILCCSMIHMGPEVVNLFIKVTFKIKSGTCTVCVCVSGYHLCASVSCHRSRSHRAHLRGDVMQAGVRCSRSAQLSVYTRVGNHSKRTGVRAGHRQRCTEAGSYKRQNTV